MYIIIILKVELPEERYVYLYILFFHIFAADPSTIGIEMVLFGQNEVMLSVSESIVTSQQLLSHIKPYNIYRKVSHCSVSFNHLIPVIRSGSAVDPQ